MTFHQVWIFPLLMFAFIPGTFILTYIISVCDDDVDVFFPYISDTGATPPESCIFGQLLNMGALFAAITVYLRHRQIMEFYRECRSDYSHLTLASLIFLWIGYIACLGMSVVANFQETSVIQVHLTGAFLAFFLALVYGYGQTVFTYIMEPVFVGKWMAHLRLFLCILATPFLVLMNATSFEPQVFYDNNSTVATTENPSPKISHDEQYMSSTTKSLYLLSVFSEWIFAFCCMAYFLTFVAEFRKTTLIPPKMVLHVELPKAKN